MKADAEFADFDDYGGSPTEVARQPRSRCHLHRESDALIDAIAATLAVFSSMVSTR